MLPHSRLSNIQWKMFTNIGNSSANLENLVCISDFFKLIEIATKKNNNFKPYRSTSEFHKIYYGKFSVNCSTKSLNNKLLNTNSDIYGNRRLKINFSHDYKLKTKI